MVTLTLFRFPIGKTDQVKKWPGDALRSFWGKWYFPANATLYVVGDLDRDVEATTELIKNTFGKLPAAAQPAPGDTKSPPQHNGVPQVAGTMLKERHTIRPPVVHK